MEGQNSLKGSLENKKSRTFVFPMGISTQGQTCTEQDCSQQVLVAWFKHHMNKPPKNLRFRGIRIGNVWKF